MLQFKSSIKIAMVCIPFFSVAHAAEWLAGDLHTHSNLSDGKNSVADIITEAERIGFDFFTITDHDWHMAGRMKHWQHPDYTSSRLTLLYGVEWTTRKGHANIFSTKPFPYRTPWLANLAAQFSWLQKFISENVEGALISANHPYASKYAWNYSRTGLHAVEVWNGPFEKFETNRKTVTDFWESEIRAGNRVVAIGGSDTHSLSENFGLGNPTTWVYSEGRSPAQVLEAISQGKVSVSCAPKAPRLNLVARVNSQSTARAGLGEKLEATEPHGEVLLQSEIVSESPSPVGTGEVLFFKNGVLLRTVPVSQFNGLQEVSDNSENRPGLNFFRAELHWRDTKANPFCPAENGSLIGLTNAVYAVHHSIL
jgi:hypothetical protein